MNTLQSRILIVEDNPGDAEVVSEALGTIDTEIHVDWAADGEDALRQFADMEAQARLPDLVILNFNLPKMTGPELFKRMHSQPSLAKIPAIMLTSSDSDSDRAACAGAEDYLIKGSTWDDTLGIAHRIVDHLRRITKDKGEPPMVIRVPPP